MEIFKLENINEAKIIKCYNENCWESALFEIDSKNFELKTQCKKGHVNIFSCVRPKEKKLFKNANIFSYYCYKCYKNINNDKDNNNNYKCKTCEKIFCNKCINIHFEEERHSENIKFINCYKKCEKHNKINNFFCKNCRINICNNCKNFHRNHYIKSYFDIIPNKNQKFPWIIDDKALNERLEYFRKIKDEFNSRYGLLIEYFKLLNILSNFIKNFNYDYYDYYNYENFNYISNYIKNESNANFKDYRDYLFFGTKLKNNLRCSLSKYKNEFFTKNTFDFNNKPFNVVNFNNLYNFKDNIFVVCSNNKASSAKELIFLEFKDYIFKRIFTYKSTNNFIFKDGTFYKKGENNKFCFYEDYNQLKILELDLINKKLNEINTITIDINEELKDLIYKKNEDIIFSCDEGLFILEKKNKYCLKQIKNKTYLYSLYNINDNLFIAVRCNIVIEFYNSEDYTFISYLNLEKYGTIRNFDFINNRLILVYIRYGPILLIDIKYFEIINIMERISVEAWSPDKEFIKIKDNYFLKVYPHKIEKKIFNEEEGIFIDVFWENNIELNYDERIIKYNDDEFMIIGRDYFKLIKFNC